MTNEVMSIDYFFGHLEKNDEARQAGEPYPREPASSRKDKQTFVRVFGKARAVS
jgi:hypothetical protein